MFYCRHLLGENISSVVLKMFFNNSSSNVNPKNSSIAKRQTNPWPPSKALEWSIIDLPMKHGKFWELRCKFCVKEFKATLITRMKAHFLGILNNMKLCSIIPQKVLEPLKEQVAKYF
jgi:hypothetical protein